MATNGSVLESNVDVLIIGAGPAGMMAACWMAHCGVKARIIDKRNSKIFYGQADGLQSRSLEIFESFGFGDRAWNEANHLIEMCMWNPGPDGVIRRSDRIPDTIVGLSRFQECVLNQGRVERFFLDNIKKYSKGTLQVERAILPESLEVDASKVDDDSAHPVTVKLRHLSEEESTPQQQVNGSKVSDGLFRSSLVYEDDEEDLIRKSQSRAETSEIVHAKYVIGCDGARSWTRRSLGFELLGEATDFIWGVLDIIPITDFPDIRMRCAVHSAENGSLMVIPRENKLVRLYIQLKEVTPDASGRADRSKITPEIIFSAAQKIISPYKLSYEYCNWWTAYQIGQRVGTHFDAHERVFLAGDAVHTHSPKAGQGMNVSMQDTYNLGWKVGLVAKGIAKRSILSTYRSERQQVAQDLIDFDHRFSRLFSGKPAKDIMDAEGVSMEEFKNAFIKGNMFATGLSVNYGPSSIVTKPDTAVDEKANKGNHQGSAAVTRISADAYAKRQALAPGIPIGMRFDNVQVLNQSDGRPWHFQQKLKSDGRFRVILFAGDVLSAPQKNRVEKFCDALASPTSFLRAATPPSAPVDIVIEILTIHSSRRVETELLRDFPEILHPFDAHVGWDYDKVFVDDVSYHEGGGDAYFKYGIDRERGCVVAVRPDQYVGWIGELEDFEGLQEYFEGILVLNPKA
ncbi:putative phenol 2-monooxygenase [Durotheca rogersii]|uniref:putative phenol 2-monooxygenase n=1 Tax=Durotheca rogersii TaxID=419775 RepID=UPI00221ED23B|nr:putative phenol 2-monooxygenase [Durotheca rogersii]KAI5861686.1 putative phenol 2-monooxygenase [Durotheca rogersii]